MRESLGEILGRGFETWKRNLNICVPFILMYLIIFTLFLVAFLPFAGPVILESGLSFDAGDLEEIGEEMEGLLILPAMAAFGLASFVVYSFFMSGTLGMAKEATLKGRTSLDTMWASGKRHWMNMLLSFVLMALMAFTLIFLFGMFSIAMTSLDPGSSWAAISFVAATAIFFIAFLILVLAFTIVPYALVIDDLGPIDAVKAGIGFFRENKLDVLLIFLLLLVISIVMGLVGGIIAAAGSIYVDVIWSLISGIIDYVVIGSLTAVWWARLYMGRTGRVEDADPNPSNPAM